MGCCCGPMSGRQPRRDLLKTPQDLESQPQNPTEAPPPYEAKDRQIFENVIADTKQPIEGPSPIPATTTGRTVRVGVRSHDHRLYCAAAGGHLEDVKRLLESGFNPSERTICDWCPLHWAANNDIEHGHAIVKLLVEYGADVNQVSDTGKTPLDLARSSGRADNVKFLEEVGAKTGAQMRRERMEL